MSKRIVVPVIIDTNVLVPSLYRQTPLLRFILKGNLALIWNLFIYEEAKEIIVRLGDRYKNKGVTDSATVLELLELILDEFYQTAEMPPDWPRFSPDRDDDPFLFAAQEGQAKFIISSDIRHILCLKNFDGIPIGSPNDFFAWAKIHYPMTDNISEPGSVS